MDKENVKISPFKKWSFALNFLYEHENDRATKATFKYCSEVPFNKFIGESARCGVKGKC